jgi:flagellar FliL protein
MSTPAKPAEAEEAAPPKSKKKLFIIVGALVVLLGGGGAAAWFLTQGGGHDASEAEAEPPKAPVYLPLETFTVNLQGGEQYLQTDITLQLGDESESEAFNTNMPRVRSRLLALLASKNADDLASADSKKQLAQEIMAQMKQPFDPKGKPQKVVDVLFTSFVIQ